MPKLRMTEQQKLSEQKSNREKSLLRAVERGKAERDFKRDYMLAKELGMKPANYSRYKKNCFQNMNFSLFCKMARVVHMTGRELCDAVGIPYEG